MCKARGRIRSEFSYRIFSGQYLGNIWVEMSGRPQDMSQKFRKGS